VQSLQKSSASVQEETLKRPKEPRGAAQPARKVTPGRAHRTRGVQAVYHGQLIHDRPPPQPPRNRSQRRMTARPRRAGLCFSAFGSGDRKS